MTTQSQVENSPQVKALRACIEDFINDRLQAKLASLEAGEDAKREKLLDDYSRENWLGNAAKRVGQIQLVTHGVKYIHPDARGSSIHHARAQSPQGPWMTSSSEFLSDDVVGNAAALDVYKFLNIEVAGQTLLQRVKANDPLLKAAFCDDEQRADDWCAAFAGITQPTGSLASHTLAKQVYFPLPDGEYHILAPLYPTALIHRAYLNIQHARFSEETKAARTARREARAHPSGYREYPNLAVRKFGGSKPQNISQLNSERRGTGYLLPSCPPNWQQQPIKAPLHIKTIFGSWLNRGELRALTRQLRLYLERLPADRTNIHMRRGRLRRVNAVVDALLNHAAAVRQLPGGWSGEPDCDLDPAEAFWLDPKRAAHDAAFAEQRRADDWPGIISQRFGSWLNRRLLSDRLRVGDPEFDEWQSQLRDALSGLAEEVNDER